MTRWRAAAAGICATAVALVTACVAWSDPYPLCNGQPICKTGWYTSPVTVSWDLNGGTNDGGCGSQSYSQDTNQSYFASELSNPVALPDYVYCTVTWTESGATYTTTVTYLVHVEMSSPTATAVPSRTPDSDGWYNHPLTVGFQGSSFSGIASCTSATYSGPDSPSQTVTGTCTDNAGKTATASFSLPYDAAAPRLNVGADPGATNVVLTWKTSGDLAPLSAVSVVRAPGMSNARRSTVYSGTGDSFADTDVKDGVHYKYTITARDQAGNTTTRTITVIPAPRLLAPAANALLTTPPRLSWTPVRGATYYNVQLYRDGKVLSAWPSEAQLQLSRTWRYEGNRHRLKPGRYRWFVWPGFGRRAADRYGHVIGRGTFIVSKPR